MVSLCVEKNVTVGPEFNLADIFDLHGCIVTLSHVSNAGSLSLGIADVHCERYLFVIITDP